jgi:hypothetical protein
MRRLAVVVTAVVVLAFPAVAVAKTVPYSFVLGKHGRVFTLHLAHTGRIRILLRYSRIRHPKADIIVSPATPTNPDGNVVIDSLDKASCTNAGDAKICLAYISGLPAGRYQVRVGLETKVRVITHLTLSWPAA